MIDPVTFGALAGFAGGALDTVGSLWQGRRQREWAEGMTRESWARDDNAVQRRAKDMESAGINPVMAAGSPASNSSPVKGEFPDPNMGAPIKDAYTAARQAQDISLTQKQKDLVTEQARSLKIENDLKTDENRGVTIERGPDGSFVISDIPMGYQETILKGYQVKYFENLIASEIKSKDYQIGLSAGKQDIEKIMTDFMLKNAKEIQEIKMKMQQEGLTQTEIDSRTMKMLEEMMKVDKWWQPIEKGAGVIGRALGGAASAGSAASGISGALLNRARRLTPSEY